MQITQNKVVTLDYILKDDAGDLIDESDGGNFSYLHGANNIIKGLEQALEGKQAGDNLQLTIEPDDAYGEINPEAIAVVGPDMFPPEMELEVGMRFNAESDNGQPMEIMITAIDEDGIVIDSNHPLAGETLHFDVLIVNVREATREELKNGQV